MSLVDKNGVPLVRPDGTPYSPAERAALRKQLEFLQAPPSRQELGQQLPQLVGQVFDVAILPNLLRLLEARYGLKPVEGWGELPAWDGPRVPPVEAASVPPTAAPAEGESP
ncbi:MAG: hypothetical protein K6V97_04025 [Actinomycetia bacterium]|nr:hypothetical protein [Actinomycetes bacterium]